MRSKTSQRKQIAEGIGHQAEVSDMVKNRKPLMMV